MKRREEEEEQGMKKERGGEGGRGDEKERVGEGGRRDEKERGREGGRGDEKERRRRRRSKGERRRRVELSFVYSFVSYIRVFLVRVRSGIDGGLKPGTHRFEHSLGELLIEPRYHWHSSGTAQSKEKARREQHKEEIQKRHAKRRPTSHDRNSFQAVAFSARDLGSHNMTVSGYGIELWQALTMIPVKYTVTRNRGAYMFWESEYNTEEKRVIMEL
ncbi:hypothetical protein PoB_001527700 [Plakobranchus ocellatus]|uniref:Uncharacterized protein n=1 Tax=Plakobranchus ocellatus TaxID=259542 RepID=A0AAV3Z0N7_9GAST|nr:hypothetical protein PoB_001527700 [Plakobranchus ocellatus]